MYLREAFVKTLAEMDEQGEFEKCINSIKKHKILFTTVGTGKRPSFFKRRREIKEIERFVKAYRESKAQYGCVHWLPLLHAIPDELLRDLVSTMVLKYEVIEAKENDNK